MATEATLVSPKARPVRSVAKPVSLAANPKSPGAKLSSWLARLDSPGAGAFRRLRAINPTNDWRSSLEGAQPWRP